MSCGTAGAARMLGRCMHGGRCAPAARGSSAGGRPWQPTAGSAGSAGSMLRRGGGITAMHSSPPTQEQQEARGRHGAHHAPLSGQAAGRRGKTHEWRRRRPPPAGLCGRCSPRPLAVATTGRCLQRAQAALRGQANTPFPQGARPGGAQARAAEGLQSLRSKTAAYPLSTAELLSELASPGQRTAAVRGGH